MVTIFPVANSLSIFQQQYLLWHNIKHRWKETYEIKKLMSPKDDFLSNFDFTLPFLKAPSQDG